jgi:hypothetical protein
MSIKEEASRKAKEIMLKAEQERIEFAEEEAKVGIQYGEDLEELKSEIKDLRSFLNDIKTILWLGVPIGENGGADLTEKLTIAVIKMIQEKITIDRG